MFKSQFFFLPEQNVLNDFFSLFGGKNLITLKIKFIPQMKKV